MLNHTYKWQLELVPLWKEQPNPVLGPGGGGRVCAPLDLLRATLCPSPGPGAAPCGGHLRAPLHSASAGRCQQALGGQRTVRSWVYFPHLFQTWAVMVLLHSYGSAQGPFPQSSSLQPAVRTPSASGVVKASVSAGPWVPQQPLGFPDLVSLCK